MLQNNIYILGQLRTKSFRFLKESLRKKIPKFHLISCCGNFVERHSFRKGLGNSPKTLRKVCLSTNFHTSKLREISVFCAVNPGNNSIHPDETFNFEFEIWCNCKKGIVWREKGKQNSVHKTNSWIKRVYFGKTDVTTEVAQYY